MKPINKLGASSSFNQSHNHSNRIRSFDYENTLTDNEDSGEDEGEERHTWKSKPLEWSDDTRMNALFASFRKRELNALHYDNKMKFWKEQIKAFCKENNVIQMNLHTLENCFMRKNIKPKCLELVIKEMLTDGSFKTRTEILRPKQGLIQTVISKCIWSPLTWSTNYLLEKTQIASYLPYRSNSTPNLCDLNSSTLSQNSVSPSSNIHFVNSIMVEQKGSELIRTLQKYIVFSNVDCIIDYEKLVEISRKIVNSNESDIELVIEYLESNLKILVHELEDSNKKVVKFTSNFQQSVSPVTDIELSYNQLKQTEQKLEKDTQNIEAEICSLNDTIKSLLKQNNRRDAMKYLKKRKQLEKSLETKDNTLLNIQAMLMSIQQADTNKLTYDAYNRSATALKEANKDVNVDKLDDTMQDLQEMMQVNSEIEDVLKSPVSSKYNFDDSELSSELAELMAISELQKPSQKTSHDESMDMSEVLNSLPKIPEYLSPEKRLPEFNVNL